MLTHYCATEKDQTMIAIHKSAERTCWHFEITGKGILAQLLRNLEVLFVIGIKKKTNLVKFRHCSKVSGNEVLI